MNVIGSVFSIFLALVLAFFCLLNRQDVPVTWLPFEDESIMPLYLICAVCTVFGFVFGSLLTWIYGSKTRKIKREQKRTIKKLEKKIGKVQAGVANDMSHDKPSGLIAIGK